MVTHIRHLGRSPARGGQEFSQINADISWVIGRKWLLPNGILLIISRKGQPLGVKEIS